MNLCLLTSAIDLDIGQVGCYGRGMEPFLTIAEAVKVTGKSRRTLTRWADELSKAGSDQVLREKTPHGYIWRISQQWLQAKCGAPTLPTVPETPRPSLPTVATVDQLTRLLDVTGKGYEGLMTMHEEVKQSYEARLREKEQQIIALRWELSLTKKSFWGRLFK